MTDNERLGNENESDWQRCLRQSTRIEKLQTENEQLTLTVNSIAAMLGFMNTPSRDVLEADIAAKRRLAAEIVQENARQSTRIAELEAKLTAMAGACRALIDCEHQEHFAARLNDAEMIGIEKIKAALAAAEK